MRKNVSLIQSPNERTQYIIDNSEKITGIISLDTEHERFIPVHFLDEKTGMKIYIEACGYEIKGNQLIIESEDEGQWIFLIS